MRIEMIAEIMAWLMWPKKWHGKKKSGPVSHLLSSSFSKMIDFLKIPFIQTENTQTSTT